MGRNFFTHKNDDDELGCGIPIQFQNDALTKYIEGGKNGSVLCDTKCSLQTAKVDDRTPEAHVFTATKVATARVWMSFL